jgi:hypothetical protein
MADLPPHAVDEIVQRVSSHAEFCFEMIRRRGEEAISEYDHPSVVFRPKLTIDGDQWCALYGDNLQDGVAGFGVSPREALWNFDSAWWAKLPLVEVAHG